MERRRLPGMARKLSLVLSAALAAALVCAVAAFGSSPFVDPTVPAKHDADPVILTGSQFPDWSARSNVTAKLPLTDLESCSGSVDPSRGPSPNDWLEQDSNCAHNHYAQPEVDTGNTLGDGTPTNELLGYRWDPGQKQFVQIPFQVDEMFTRYLDNSASGFSIYSGEDQHTTYAFDREGFRYTVEDPNNPCHALPDSPPAQDPVKGLDDNDEMVFMASDAGPQAPADAQIPSGIDGVREVRIDDPTNPGAAPTYAYVMKAAADGPKPAFTADNGYVKYQRDATADDFVYSQSSYDNYGNATTGHFMWDGQCVGAADTKANEQRCANAPTDPPNGVGPNDPPITDPNDPRSAFFLCPQRHRPADTATITTSRYKFRYDGRWLLTALQISPDGGQTFGPDLIDRWKARAFAQDPYSQTPCCGYEDEDKNWGGSSTLLGEKIGPVRAIRETWGADSGTNVIRRETFYRDTIRQKTFLRVHVIPPADGIYAQWDFNAGKVDKYFNPRQPAGVAVDGKNDENVGNFDDPCNSNWDSMPGRSQLDQAYRDMYQKLDFCTPPCDPAFGSGQCLPLNKYHLSMDVTDPTFNNVNASLDWNEVSGPYGTIVDRYQLDKVTDATPGGLPQELLAVPYYRDDSCFDDGTGSDPGPRLIPRSDSEPRTYTAPDGTTQKRVCWTPADGDPAGNPKYFQGDIGTHGLHLLMIAESDNARQTVPVDEIVSEQRIVMLPGDQGNVGEQYGRSFEKPLVANAVPFSGSSAPAPAAQDPNSSAGGSAPGDSSPGGSNGGTADGSAYATPPAQDSQQQAQGEHAARITISCLSSNRVRTTRNAIAGLRIGMRSGPAIRHLGRPTGFQNGAYAWCVKGGGKLVAFFNRKGTLQLVAVRPRAKAKVSYRAARKLRGSQIRRLLRQV
jgi:hypothetical protein